MEMRSVEQFDMERGHVFIVESPVECDRNLQAFVRAAAPVFIDGTQYDVIGIEHFLVNGPIIVGEKVGLLVRPVST